MTRAVMLLLCAVVCMSLFVGCSSGDVDDGSEERDTSITISDKTEGAVEPAALAPSDAMTVDTALGSLYYPDQWNDFISVEEDSQEGFSSVLYQADFEGTKYDLFKVGIDTGDGQKVGTLTDENGVMHEVYILMYSVDGIEGLSPTEQDRLYAMQEGVNYLVENLK